MNLLDIPQPLPSNPSHEVIGTMSENELNGASGVFDEDLDRELTNREAMAIFPGLRVSSSPNELLHETVLHNSKLHPENLNRISDMGKLLSSVISEPVHEVAEPSRAENGALRRDHPSRHTRTHGHTHRRSIEVTRV